MEVPDLGDAAWFTASVKPGRVGPSVITAHVDSVDGPDVFFHLDELVAGDEIEVHGEDGDVVVFEATALEQHPKDAYPREAVHGATEAAELRLITCGGAFDQAVGHYDDNIIVFAERQDV
jgi:sortase (surface protein transpeptidase)